MTEIKAKKSLGQNFLNDENVLKNIADSITTTNQDLIIEVGPGKGALTKYLLKKDAYLVCYEVDLRLKNILATYQNEKAKIIYQDFLQSDILEDTKDMIYQDVYMIANIPYYRTTPIIKKAINIPNLKAMTLLVQKEVAERLTAKPGMKANGSLTLFLNYYFQIDYLFQVKNTCFTPVPKVDSAVVLFKKKEEPKVINKEHLFQLIEDAFRLKRKTLRNNLKDYDWNIIKSVLESHQLSLAVRAEELSLNIFIEISDKLNSY